MNRLFNTAIALTLVTVLVASPALAKTHSFELDRGFSINGTQLGAGTYKLELNGNGGALIYKGRNQVAEAQVEVRPRSKSGQRAVILAADGAISEIRLKNQVVVFIR